MLKLPRGSIRNGLRSGRRMAPQTGGLPRAGWIGDRIYPPGLIALASQCWIGIALLCATQAAAVPAVVPYLGYLTYEAGAPYQGAIQVTVEVHSAAVGGASLWGPHLFTDVPVQDGTFTLVLGGASSPSLAPAIHSGLPLWLSFRVNDVLMTPRQEVVSVPFALKAGSADLLGGLPASSFAQVAALPNVALSGSYADLIDVPPPSAEASGTVGAIARFTGSAELGDSMLSETNGMIGVGVSQPKATLDVGGGLKVGTDTAACDPSRAGTIRWTGSALEVCLGSAWAPVGAVAPPTGQASFTNPGTHTFVVPSDVTSISAVVIGAGGAAGQNNWGGGGGALAYKNNISVTPGQQFTVVVGAGGSWTQNSSVDILDGGNSSFAGMTATGGRGAQNGSGGTATGGDVNRSGGNGGVNAGYPNSGGGGAAGYTQNGQDGVNGQASPYISGAGGAAGDLGTSGGSGSTTGSSFHGGSGGGTGLYGIALGLTGANGTSIVSMGQGGNYGGGAGSGGNGFGGTPSRGGNGAVRIVWPGTTRQFPESNLADVD